MIRLLLLPLLGAAWAEEPARLTPLQASANATVIRQPWGRELEADAPGTATLTFNVDLAVCGWEDLALSGSAGGATIATTTPAAGVLATALPIRPPMTLTVALPLQPRPYRILERPRLALSALVADGSRSRWLIPADPLWPAAALPGGGSVELRSRRGERVELRIDRQSGLRLTEVRAIAPDGLPVRLRWARRDDEAEGFRILIDAPFGDGGAVELVLAERLQRIPLAWSAPALDLGLTVPAAPPAPARRMGAEDF